MTTNCHSYVYQNLMNRFTSVFSMLAMLAVGVYLVEAEYIDAPDVTNTTSDIADFYAFESQGFPMKKP